MEERRREGVSILPPPAPASSSGWITMNIIIVVVFVSTLIQKWILDIS